MELNEEQKKTVAGWFAAGASLDEIQKRIRSEFDVHMTYLDVRLLVAELPQPVEAEEGGDGEGAAATPDAQNVAAAPSPSQTSAELADQGEAAAPSPSQTGEVAVTVDALMIPGTIASGEVTFSDGTTGKWYVDQTGRLGLGDLPEGYRPNSADAAVFQSKLMSALQAKGLC